MNFVLVSLFTWLAVAKAWSLREGDPFPPDYEEPILQEIQDIADEPEEAVKELRVNTTSATPVTTTKDIELAAAKQNALHVLLERMFLALGPNFPVNKNVIPSNESLPTVVIPLNITTDPCPELYAKCSSEIFFSSCKSPRNSNPYMWKRRFNLFFDLPHDLLDSDELLNATLRLYKNGVLPISEPSLITIELHRYIKSLTRKRDVHLVVNSTTVKSDYKGWVSIDVTELIRNMKPKKNHGFLVKVKDAENIFWINHRLFVPMDCSSDSISILPLPIGVQTNQPEQRFPSLQIRTGRPDLYYSDIHSLEIYPINEDRTLVNNEKEFLVKEKEFIVKDPAGSIFDLSRSSRKYFDQGEDYEATHSDRKHPIPVAKPLPSMHSPIKEEEYGMEDTFQMDEQVKSSKSRQVPTELSLSLSDDETDATPESVKAKRPTSHGRKKNKDNPRPDTKANSGSKKRVNDNLSDPLEEVSEKESEQAPYSSIEISIHSNGWNKPAWSIPDLFTPRRHTQRKRRHRQHNKKRATRHVHHNAHKQSRKDLSSSRSRS